MSKPLSVTLATLLLVAVGALFLWWRSAEPVAAVIDTGALKRSGEPVAESGAGDIAAEIERPAAPADGVASVATASALPPVDAPLHASLPQLLDAAEAGDPLAACRLATQSTYCHFQQWAEVRGGALQQGLRVNVDPATGKPRDFMLRLEARFNDNLARSEQFCPEGVEQLPAAVDWFEAASQRGHVRAGTMLALFDPANRQISRARANTEPFSIIIRDGRVPPPSAYLIENVDSLLQRGRQAGDPLALEASILRSAPDPGLQSVGGEFRVRRADPIAFSTWVETWQRLFPDKPLDEDILAAHEREWALRTAAEREAISAAAAREASLWPGDRTPSPVEFELDPVLDLCESS